MRAKGQCVIDGANDNEVDDDEDDDDDDDDENYEDDNNDGADGDDVVVFVFVCVRTSIQQHSGLITQDAHPPRKREVFTLRNRGLSEMAPQRTIHSQAKG